MTAPTDACSTTMGQNLFNVSQAEIAQANIMPGDVGAFANLELGIGGGTVGVGLTGLASLSDQIRVGGPPTATNTYGLPSTADPNAGPEFVLQSVGLSSSALASISSVNAGVAATAQIQAGTIFGQVQAGTFTNDMIPGAFSAFQNATALLSALFVPGTASAPPATNFGTMCGAKPYAIDLISLAPKYKFLFVVQFEFNPEFNEVLSSIDPAFVIKSTTRPNVKFDLEPTNFYNFRSAVTKKVTYEPMLMKFYDDDYNNIFQFYNTYLKLYSPIANIDIESAKVDPLDAYENVGGGMGFSQPTVKIQTGWSNTVGQEYAGSLGPLGTNSTVRNALRRISIFHVYKQGRMMNVYHFYNPKITQLTLDELDMASTGDGNEVAITFEYDSVYIIPGYRVLINNTQYNLNAMTSDGVYPFGQIPGSIEDDGNPKDGTGRGGIDYGQNIILANAGNNNTAVTPVPASVANFDPTLRAISGSSLQTLANNMPNVTSGSNNSSAAIQGASSSDLQNVTVTAQTIPDPVTGTTQDSADNSGNLGNVLGQNVNNVSAAQQLAAANGPPQTLEDSIQSQSAVQSAVYQAQTQTSQPSTTSEGAGQTKAPNGDTVFF